MGGLPPKPGLSHVSVLFLPSAKVCGFLSLTHSLPVCHVPDTVHSPGVRGHSLHGPVWPRPSLLQPHTQLLLIAPAFPVLPCCPRTFSHAIPYWVWLTPTQPLPLSCPCHPECPRFPPSPDSAPRPRGPGSGRPLGCAGLNTAHLGRLLFSALGHKQLLPSGFRIRC